ncbi:MAG: heavy-metal-associated domain-containing protein [Myxococcota bacterium]
MDAIKLGIDGMTCGGCVLSVEKALQRVPGVKKFTVSLDKKEAVVGVMGLDRTRLEGAVTDAGYDVR